MIPDIATTAVERTEAAERLVREAQNTAFVELVTVSALELCVLGAPRHALFDELVTHAWLQLADKRREKLIKLATDGMVERGLLTANKPGPGSGKSETTYSVNPSLAIALAARCRPAFIVVTETADSKLRTPRFFALGDQGEPVRGIVVEEPAALPAGLGDFPAVKKLGPLGRFYRYVLISQAKAAEVLAEWAIAPPPRAPGPDDTSVRSLSLYRHREGQDAAGIRLGIRGDGSTAQLVRPGTGDSDQAAVKYDLAGLGAVMLDLISAQAR